MAKLSKKERNTIHRQVLEMVGGADRGPTWIGVGRSTIFDNNHDTKRHKKARRTESKALCRIYY